MDAQETSILTSVLIACFFIAVIISYFVVTIIRHQRRSQRLHKTSLLAEIGTLESERARIASDLHDELGPILLSVKYNMNSLDIHSEDDICTLEKTNKTIDASIARIREISNNLMPSVLLRKGLVVALEESIENLKKMNPLIITFHYESMPSLSNEKQINIYRIVQEIINNTQKHSKATDLLITLDTTNQKLTLSTADNGIGFDYRAALKEGKGIGLRNLLSRTEILHGDMFLDSIVGNGTRYTFEIPL